MAVRSGVGRYRVVNRSKQTTVALEMERAATSWARLKGLLGRKPDEFSAGKGLWIVPSQGVHTLGMSFPIDVVYLGEGGQVIHLYHRLKPHRIAALKLRARSVIELPAGSLARARTEIGDVLEISEVNAEGG